MSASDENRKLTAGMTEEQLRTSDYSPPPEQKQVPPRVYMAKYDLKRLYDRCDLGNFISIEAALYPHKDNVNACEVYVPEQLLREARAGAFEEVAHRLSEMGEKYRPFSSWPSRGDWNAVAEEFGKKAAEAREGN